MLNERVVFLDLETTGATATHDHVTEIGIVEVDRGRLVGEWSTLVNPGVSIPPAIQALTGITNNMVAVAPTFPELSRELLCRLEGRLLVAHNARFDYGFLRHEFQRAGARYSSRVLCTVRLSRRLYPQHARHSLDALLLRHGIECDARHRALGDARALWRLMQCWQRERAPSTIAAAVAELVSAPTVPEGLPVTSFDDIPEAPGVYRFYGENNVVLYVGKSINLRSRVMSHFSGDRRENRDMRMAREISRIDWTETGGELGALIEEARLVRQLEPVYNRRPGRTTELCAWRWRTDEPASMPQIVSGRDLDPASFDDLHGLFRSRAAAIEAMRGIATAHGLCPVLLGLEKRKGPCLAHQLKRCRGACIGEESSASHGLRLAQALATLRMRPWPFRGRIGVREAATSGDRTDVIVLDRWCYLGTARSEDELREIQERPARPVFDLDTYRILTRFLARPHGGSKVIELAAA
jgi:DNA polymerase-3 subunit epsilon